MQEKHAAKHLARLAAARVPGARAAQWQQTAGAG
jgi:hypothetical protein